MVYTRQVLIDVREFLVALVHMELSTRLGKFTFHAYSSPPLRIASQNTKNKHSNTKPERGAFKTTFIFAEF